jgi:hypothetical protein
MAMIHSSRMRSFALKAAVIALQVAGGAAVACSANDSTGGSGVPSGGSSGSSGFGQGGAAGNGGSGNSANGGVINTGAQGGAGGSLTDGGECFGVSQQAENRIRPVDIIMAIDNSGSMTFEAGEVQNNMNTFASAILNQGIDVHVAIISVEGPPSIFTTNGVCIPAPLGSGACPNDSKPPGYLRVDQEVSSTDALQRFLQDYQQYKPVLRQNALKYFAVVTDDDSSMPAAQFIQGVGTLDPGWFDVWRFFGVFCTGSCPVLGACANTGTVYLELTQQSGTVPGDMCQGQSNFAAVFSQLAQTIGANKKLDCEWAIPPPPPGQTFSPNLVNVRYTPGNGQPPQDIYFVDDPSKCGPQGGWYYDNNQNPTRVKVCPATCGVISNDVTGLVDILFGCATVPVPR